MVGGGGGVEGMGCVVSVKKDMVGGSMKEEEGDNDGEVD